MPIDVSALTTYSWADIAKAAKQAMITVAVRGQRSSDTNNMLEKASLSELADLYALAQQMIADEDSESSAGLALVQFGERV